MRLDHMHLHLSRRRLLGGMAAAGAVAGTGGALLSGSGLAGASTPKRPQSSRPERAADISPDDFDDSFDHNEALDGTWAAQSAARYGATDEIGTLNEVTPEKTARALSLLAGASAVATYRMGHLMRNGIPAYVTFPPRKYQQRLFVTGYTPDHPEQFFSTEARGNEGEDQWRAADRDHGPLGYLAPNPIGPNLVSAHEERFPEGGTYQIATQFDNLNHVGVGPVFYNGFRGNQFASAVGTTSLGMDKVPPFVTRGVLLDVLGWKQAVGSSGIQTISGNDMLEDNYRITLDDILGTMEWEGLAGIEPGDVVVIRTGWWKLAEDPSTYDHYLKTEPGIYLREAKFLAEHRPVVIAADTWALEVLGHPDVKWAFPVHQTLLTRWGIRIGEGVLSDDLAAAKAYEFVYSYSPQWAYGATAGNVPPLGLAPLTS
jgi:kynurenine formamidase